MQHPLIYDLLWMIPVFIFSAMAIFASVMLFFACLWPDETERMIDRHETYEDIETGRLVRKRRRGAAK